MWQDVLNILFYSALGLITLLVSRRAKRLHDEWKELKAQMKEEEREKERLAALSEEERALEERRRLQIQQAQAAIDRHRKEIEEQAGGKKQGSIFDV